MPESFEDRLQAGRVAYRTKNSNGSYTLRWMSLEGWQEKVMWGEFNSHQWARNNFDEVIQS